MLDFLKEYAQRCQKEGDLYFWMYVTGGVIFWIPEDVDEDKFPFNIGEYQIFIRKLPIHKRTSEYDETPYTFLERWDPPPSY